MKRYILPALALSLLASSCNLDLTPENAITYSNSFDTEAELNTTTASIHFYLDNCMDAFTPLTKIGLLADETQDDNQLREGNPRSIIEAAADWENVYNMIFESNLLLDNIGKTKGLSEERYAFHAGQAHFALGFGYFMLSRAYGQAVVTDNSKYIKLYGLSTQQEVIDAAIKHAQKAFELLPTYDKLRTASGSIAAAKQYGSKGNAATLLAHLYAWKGSMAELYGDSSVDAAAAYRKSVEYATKVINGEVGSYSLVSTPDELCKLLSNPEATNPEDIFSLVYDKSRGNTTTSKNEVAGFFATWPVNDTKQEGDIAQASFRLKKSTIKALYPDASDLRRTAFFYKFEEDHTIAGESYAIPYKFRTAVYSVNNTTDAGKEFISINANYVYWRLADVYLLRAECSAKIGDNATAIADLNKIRARAGATAYPASGESDLKKAIFHEREREFILENDSRYYDILRNGIDYVKTELQGKFPTLTAADIAGGALCLPIPSSAQRDKFGKVINGRILQRPYWFRYM